MSELYVDPGGLWGLYNLLVRLRADATATLSHVRKWCEIGGLEEGIILHLRGSHNDVYGDITRKLDRAQLLALDLHSRVQNAANAFARADLDALRRFDGGVHPTLVLSEPMDQVLAEFRPALQSDHSTFADAAEAQPALVSPEGVAGDTAARQRIRQAGWLLVAGLVLTAYETLIR